MASMDIVLSDKAGNPNLYSNVSQIGVLAYNADNEEYTQLFTRMNWLNLYLVRKQDDGKYLVVDYYPLGSSDSYCVCDITDKQCQELGRRENDGSYALVVIYTLKSLSVGNAYGYAELF